MSPEEARPRSSRGLIILAAVALAILAVFLRPRDQPAAPLPPRVPALAPAEVAPPTPPEAPPKPAAEPPKAEPPAKPAEAATTGAIVGTALRLDGVPAAGAKVRAAPGGDEEKRAVATAGADGAFRFDSLAPGRWRVAVAGGGYGTRLDQGREDVAAEVVAGGEARVEVRAQALAEISGRVHDTEGKPVAKASLEVHCAAFLSADGGVWSLKAVSGDDGAFTVKNVSPGEYVSLTVKAPGFGTGFQDLHDIAPGAKVEVDVKLERGATLVLLFVADDDGTPVREAIVWVSDDEEGRLYAGPHGDSWKPDQEGRVQVDGIRPRPVNVQIEAKGFVRVPDTRLDFPARPGPFEIRFVRAFAISGRVLRADGTPAPGVRVRAGPEKGEDPMAAFRMMMDISAETGADGAFRIEGLPAGRFKVGVVDNSLEYLASAVAEAGAIDVRLTLPADRSPRRVTVRAVDPEGKPVPQARYFTGRMLDGEPTGGGGGGMHHDEDTIDIEPPETAFVEIWDARDAKGVRLPLGYVFHAIPDDAPEVLLVTLPAEKTIEGMVVGPEGQPREGAGVQVVKGPPGKRESFFSHELVGTASGADGKFRVVGLGSGRVRLRATADGFVGTPVEAEAGARDVVLSLQVEVVCELRILDPAGEPLEGADVFASVGREDRKFGPPRASTDAAGRARLRGLVPGASYTLFVNPPRSRRDLQSIRRQDWTPVAGEIRFEKGAPAK